MFHTVLTAAIAAWALLFFGLVGDTNAGVPDSKSFLIEYDCTITYPEGFTIPCHYHLWTDEKGTLRGGH